MSNKAKNSYGMPMTENSKNMQQIGIPLTRLLPGVDNIHIDVRISPALRGAVRELAEHLINHFAGLDEIAGWKMARSRFQQFELFKNLCSEVMQNAVSQANQKGEIQIDMLAQAAICVLFAHETDNCYQVAMQKLKSQLLRHERHQNQALIMMLQEKRVHLSRNRDRIIGQVLGQFFSLWIEINCSQIDSLREVYFGSKNPLPAQIFTNPLFAVDNQPDAALMTDVYALMGHRQDDPNRLENISDLLKTFVLRMLQRSPLFMDDVIQLADSVSVPDANDTHWRREAVEKLMQNPLALEQAFDFFKTRRRMAEFKQAGADAMRIRLLAARARHQKRMLKALIKLFAKHRLAQSISAAFLLKDFYRQYCPPLHPQEVLSFLVEPTSRPRTRARLKKMVYPKGKKISLSGMKRQVRRLKFLGTKERYEHVLWFLGAVSRFSRDQFYYHMLKDATDEIRLVNDPRDIRLSRANRTLYEFLLTDEQSDRQKAITSHVVIKADVRGSTEIVAQMNAKGLNPASNFSLNFFDPITALLGGYGANKVFIEGDAIILSILGYQDQPQSGFIVARACGLAINVLRVVEQYNRKNVANGLPPLILGIGIDWVDGAPTFFFDEDHQIMISPAINHADRLSSSSAELRHIMENRDMPFDVYAFHTLVGSGSGRSDDIKKLYYNVSGIHLGPEAFRQIEREIRLRRVECSLPEFSGRKICLHAGKFPTLDGNYRELVIREAPVPRIDPDDFKIVGLTDEKYYEVSTRQRLYDLVKESAPAMAENQA